MTASQRDFRTYYYFQLGMKGVNLKNIESLLNETVVDVSKVRELCTRSKIPTHYRCVLWKLLIGVYPQFRESWSFVNQQLQEQFNDLKECVDVIEPFVPSNQHIDQTLLQCERLFHLYLTERRFVHDVYLSKKNDTLQLDDKRESEHFIMMMQVFLNVCQQATSTDGTASIDKINPEMDAYWLFSTFMNKHFGSSGINWRDSISWLVNELRRLIVALEPHVYAQVIVPHSQDVDAIFANWFASIFSSYLPVHTTQKLWDSVMVFPFEYIAYIGLAFIKNLNSKLLASATDMTQVSKILTQLQDCDSDYIVYNSIALFQQQKNFTNTP